MSNKLPLANFQPLIYLLPISIKNHQIWVLDWLKKQGCSKNALNDSQVYWINQDQKDLGIDSIRELINEMSYAPYKAGSRYVVALKLDQATKEAQNALLKTLEQPPNQTQFIITTAQTDSILPTILSRSLVETIDSSSFAYPNKPENQTVFEFSSFSQAINEAEKFKDRQEAEQKLKEWLGWLTSKNREKNLHKIKLVQNALLALQQNGNVRLVLENCFFQTLTLSVTL